MAQQGCTKCCPPLTQWVLLPCVEELGETVRAGLKQGTETLFPQMLRTQKGHAQAGQGGGRGCRLASTSPSEGLTQEAAGVRWRSSGNARQLRGDVLSCPPPSLSIKYTPRRHSCAVRTAASRLPALCYSFHSAGCGSGGLAGWPARAPTLPGSRFHSSQSESLARGVGSLSGSSSF